MSVVADTPAVSRKFNVVATKIGQSGFEPSRPSAINDPIGATEVAVNRSGSAMNVARVLLLRHAATTSPDVWHGAESDVGLSEFGREKARRVAVLLAAEKPVVVVCSGMRRAIETAELIAEACGVHIAIEPALHERRIGELCGQPFDEANKLWADTLLRWTRGETGFAPSGAESFDDLRNRVLPIWQRLADEHAGQTYVVVAHGGVIRCLLLSLGVANDWNAFRCDNLALHTLSGDGMGWRLLPSAAEAPLSRKATLDLL